jgi:hypothetical protein
LLPSAAEQVATLFSSVNATIMTAVSEVGIAEVRGGT